MPVTLRQSLDDVDEDENEESTTTATKNYGTYAQNITKQSQFIVYYIKVNIY